MVSRKQDVKIKEIRYKIINQGKSSFRMVFMLNLFMTLFLFGFKPFYILKLPIKNTNKKRYLLLLNRLIILIHLCPFFANDGSGNKA